MKTLSAKTRRNFVATLSVVALAGITACGGGSGTSSDSTVTSSDVTAQAKRAGSITVYSGRSEALIAPLLQQFTADTGIEVLPRYGDTGEMAALILTEGEASPADVFFSQDGGALGAVEEAGLFAPLGDDVLGVVDSAYRSANGFWVGTSGRVRVVVYNPTLVAEAPTSIDELLDKKWNGKIGFAPSNASWQSFVTALRVLRGEDGAREWLEGFAANKPVAFEKNGAVRDAVNSGEVSLGLINHYYLYEKVAAEGAENVVVKNQFLAPNDPGGLVNVAGVGLLAGSENSEAATAFIAYLLSPAGQKFFAEKTFEYPLVAGTNPSEGLPLLADLQPPAINLSDLRSIEMTQELLTEVGLLTK